MTKRNINGKSLEHFNESRLDIIGIQDFDISVFLMQEIATLRTKYNYNCHNDDRKDNDEQDQKSKVPPKFLCPLTNLIMKDPVIAFDSNTYERQAIEKHLKEKGTSPITGSQAYIMNVYPNQELKEEIEAFCVANYNNVSSNDVEGYPSSMNE